MPEGYWPAENLIADHAALKEDLAGYRAATRELETLILDPATDLSSPTPGSDVRTVMSEILAASTPLPLTWAGHAASEVAGDLGGLTANVVRKNVEQTLTRACAEDALANRT
ncbi:MAG: hypothetical protein ACRD28_02865 [Acidobacteriaceae bacterium]